jgi:hypothetical protein
MLTIKKSTKNFLNITILLEILGFFLSAVEVAGFRFRVQRSIVEKCLFP